MRFKGLQNFEVICYLEHTDMFDEYYHKEGDQSQMITLFQSQKRICQGYIQIACQQLYLQEAQTISAANDLLERLTPQESREIVKDLSEWDVFSTRDSVLLEDENSFNLSTLSQDSRGKLRRKTLKTSRPGREVDGSLTDCLQEIEQNCSARVCATVNKVVQEYRRLKLKMFETDKKQFCFDSDNEICELVKNWWKSSNKKTQCTYVSNRSLSTRLEDLDETVAKLKQDNLTLKNQNSELQQKCHSHQSQSNSERKIKLFQEIISHSGSSQHHSPDLLSQFVTEKQKLISLRFEAVRRLQEKVQRQLFSTEGGCSRCCGVLDKMKGSICAYKEYLQREGEEFEKLVDHYKAALSGDSA